MNLSQYQQIEPQLLVSLVNTKLRNEFDSLFSLCRFYEIDAKALEEKLNTIGYQYNTEINQFR